MNTNPTCALCTHFLGGGDWNLCCSNPPKDQVGWAGFLCYEDTPACENFELKGKPVRGKRSEVTYLYDDYAGSDIHMMLNEIMQPYQPNCDLCVHIMPNEYRQNKSPRNHHYMCGVYGTRCYHNTSVPRKFHSYIYPCAECEKDGYKNYKEAKE